MRPMSFSSCSGPVLLEGRVKLVEENNGTRYKLRSSDGNDIDSFFVERRKRYSIHFTQF